MLAALAGVLRETLVARHLEERRHGGDEERHAARRGGLRRGRARVRAPRRRDHAARLGARPRGRRRAGWLARFPMCDWVGGRTSELSAVGLLPAALQGIDVDGAARRRRRVDEATRVRDALRNPAALLALMWHHAGGGRGEKDMVVLPYKDRLLLLGRYLQQLVMESLGKRLDLAGRARGPGPHRLRQQGLDRPARVRAAAPRRASTTSSRCSCACSSRAARALEVEPGVTAGDYLHGFLLGTRAALARERARVDHAHAAARRCADASAR